MPTINTELIPDLYQMPDYYWIMLYVTVFLFGIIIGSFLNVCIYRIPAKESIVPDSHCMSCQHRLYWYDLFPVFSLYVFKRQMPLLRRKGINTVSADRDVERRIIPSGLLCTWI